MRALGEVVVGLIEADVTVVANAEQLQIGVAGGSDDLVVLGAGSGGIGVRTVGHMRVVQIDVDVIEEVLTHKVVIALGIVMRKATILVQVVGADLGKVDVTLLVPSSKLLVGTNRSRAGGKAQHAIGLEDNLGRDDIGGLTAHILVVFSFNDLHYASFLVQERQGSPYTHLPAARVGRNQRVRPPGRGRVMYMSRVQPRRGPCPSTVTQSCLASDKSHLATEGVLFQGRPP